MVLSIFSVSFFVAVCSGVYRAGWRQAVLYWHTGLLSDLPRQDTKWELGDVEWMMPSAARRAGNLSTLSLLAMLICAWQLWPWWSLIVAFLAFVVLVGMLTFCLMAAPESKSYLPGIDSAMLANLKMASDCGNVRFFALYDALRNRRGLLLNGQ